MNVSLKTSLIAASLIVVLRLAIGWQLFYEGVWKLNTLDTPKPWTSAGYLRNSQGPMRATFRKMTGDPDELDWLDAKKVSDRWLAWKTRFANHYGLDKKQSAKLNSIVVGSKAYYSDTGVTVPESVDLSKITYRSGKDKDGNAIRSPMIQYDEERKRLWIDGKVRPLSKEYGKYVEMLPKADEDGKFSKDSDEEAIFRVQLEKLYKRYSRLSYIEKLKASLNGDPNNVGILSKGNPQSMGEIKLYREMLADYEKAEADTDQAFEFAHQAKAWSDVQSKKASLIGPIKALESSMQDDAFKLLTIKQIQRGSVSSPWTSLRLADTMTMIGLTLLGLCLICGLFTRFSAVMAAFMVFSFYLAMPPLPGLPEGPGPEHSMVVNKNLIESLALLAIAAFPSGYWFGLDALVGKLWRKLRGRKSSAKAATA